MWKGTAYGLTAACICGWAYMRNLQLPRGPDRMTWGRQVFGHRGCRDVTGIPENTLEAFHYAMTNGAHGIEIDVKLTKDKEVVVFHDGNTRRLMNGDNKWLHQITLQELQGMNYKEDPTGKITVPTLHETIKFCQDNYLQLLIEIKETQDVKTMMEKILEFYDRYGEEFLYQHSTVISFNPFVMYKLRARNPKIAICQLTSDSLMKGWSTMGTEPLPTWMKSRFAPISLVDNLIWGLQTRIAPWVTGASMIGPRYDKTSAEFVSKWKHRKLCVYMWGFPTDGDPQVNFSDRGNYMLDEGVFIAVDKKYANYGAQILEVKQREAEVRRELPPMEMPSPAIGSSSSAAGQKALDK